MVNKSQLFEQLKQELNKKRAFAILMLFICIIGVFNAFRFGAASLDYYTVRNIIEVWQSSEKQTLEQFMIATDAVDAATFFHSSHPLYRDLSGQVQEWGVLSENLPEEALLLAKDNYIEATKMRPSWPVTWASLAMIKWRLQEYDAQMLEYLNAADNLGDRTPEVHILFTELGLTLYEANHPFYRNINKQTQERLLLGLKNPRSRKRVLQAIRSNDAKDTACNWTRLNDSHVYEKILKCS